MKRVLLTGAGGYIGRHLPKGLIARGYEVHAISRDAPKDPGKVFWHTTDLLDTSATSTLLEEISATHLMHLAWVTKPGTYLHSSQNTAWLGASKSLLESFVEYGGHRAVLAGSCAEYDWTNGHCVENVTPLRAKSLYAETKLALRNAAYVMAETSDLTVVWARVFFSFGPHERIERLVPAIIHALLAGERAKCVDGSVIRDFMYVPDIANAMIAVLDSEVCGDINIASGNPLSLEDLATRISGRLDATDRVDFGHYPRRPDDPQKITADVSRLTDEVGWAPKHDLDSAIDETIDWWRNHAL